MSRGAPGRVPFPNRIKLRFPSPSFQGRPERGQAPHHSGVPWLQWCSGALVKQTEVVGRKGLGRRPLFLLLLNKNKKQVGTVASGGWKEVVIEARRWHGSCWSVDSRQSTVDTAFRCEQSVTFAMESQSPKCSQNRTHWSERVRGVQSNQASGCCAVCTENCSRSPIEASLEGAGEEG